MRKSMSTVDTVVVILIFGITAVLAIAFVKHYMEVNVPTPIANPSETARFVRYMTCVIAACSGGCDSSKTYSVTLEYGKGDQPTLGCNQLLHELGYCTGANPEAKLCGRSYYLNFTFKGEEDIIKYTANYSVTMGNPGPCSPISQEGWQTDASCLGNWEEFMPCPCYKCRVGGEVSRKGGGVPAGKLLVNNGGCGDVGDTPVYGAIWVPNTMVGDDVPGKCVKWTGTGFPEAYDALAWCNFKKDQTIYIWATDADSIRDECLSPFNYFIGCCSSFGMFSYPLAPHICIIPPTYVCPQVMLCESVP